MTVQRPWGKHMVLEEKETDYKLKRIEAAPGARLICNRINIALSIG